MTDTTEERAMTESVEVTQADRAAAASLNPDGRERDQILRGKRNKTALVQAFARHRLAHSEALTEALRERDQAREALLMARQFIENGIEFGYITMPDDDCPDTAHDTLPAIIAALEGLSQ